jgi:predicted component of viral defense system (DUF524 family)
MNRIFLFGSNRDAVRPKGLQVLFLIYCVVAGMRGINEKDTYRERKFSNLYDYFVFCILLRVMG